MYSISSNLISVDEVLRLSDSDKVIVSRSALNSAIVKIQCNNKILEHKEQYLILSKAVERMLNEEKKLKFGVANGTFMTVEDIKKAILPNISTSINTFRKSKLIPNYSDEKVIKGKKSIFLASPIPRDKALSFLSQQGFEGVVYIPEYSTMKQKDDDNQAMWMREALTEASIILFWIPRDLEKMPDFKIDVDFGYWISKKRIVYGRPDNTPKTKYLDWLYDIEYNEKPFNNLNEMLQVGIEMAQEEYNKQNESYINSIAEEDRDIQDVKKFIK